MQRHVRGARLGRPDHRVARLPRGAVRRTWYHAALANALSGIDRATSTTATGHPRALQHQPRSGQLPRGRRRSISDSTPTKAPRSISWPSCSTSSGTASASRRRPTARPALTFGGFPRRYDHFLFDQTQNLLWANMTDAQRAASAINTRRLAWTGANVTANVPNVLSAGHARADRDRAGQHRQHLPDRRRRRSVRRSTARRLSR